MRLKMEGKRGCIFTGNPGIGKSAWLNYALVRFLRDGFAVVLERAKSNDFFVFKDGSCIRRKFRRPDLDELPDKAVYLFDPDENDSHPLESNVFTVVASSPQEKHYKALWKIGAAKRYFPCWSLEELQQAKPQMDASDLEALWLQWGGIPRYIYNDDQAALLLVLNATVNDVKLQLIEKFRGTAEIPEDKQRKLSHMVVQYSVKEPYDKGELDFASVMIGELVVALAAAKTYDKLLAHYEWTRRQLWQGAYAGHLWEHLCNAMIPKGCPEGFLLESLTVSKKANRRVVKGAMTVVGGTLNDMISILNKGCYFRPRAANFPVVDAVLMEGDVAFGLQMTIATSHPPSAACLLQLKTRLAPKKLHLVWVVDVAKDGHIDTAQTFADVGKIDVDSLAQLRAVPQWVLKLHFPKERPW